MNAVSTILFRTLVKQFYRQHAGLFAFLIFIMVAAVGRANDVGLLEYHYSLMKAILVSNGFRVMVLTAWLFYLFRCQQFMNDTLRKPINYFLFELSRERLTQVFFGMLAVGVMLLLPVLLYASMVIRIGFKLKLPALSAALMLFCGCLCIGFALWNSWLFKRQALLREAASKGFFAGSSGISYCGLLLRFIFQRRKMLLLSIKLFNGAVLYGMLRNESPADTDLRMVFLFYAFGLMGHGVLILKIRSMEETDMSFYRGMPVSVLKRFSQYAMLYAILLIPESIIIIHFTPVHLQWIGALNMLFFGWSMLLLLNSLLFVRIFAMLDYLKILSGIYLALFIGLLAGILPALIIISLVVALLVFCSSYYEFERRRDRLI